MTYTAHAYVANENMCELPCAYACAQACGYLTSENQALPFVYMAVVTPRHVTLVSKYNSGFCKLAMI